LKESSFLLSGIKIIVKDEIGQNNDEFKYDDGIKSFVEFVNSNKTKLSGVIFVKDKNAEMEVEIGMQYTDSYSETIISFVNNVKTKDGGTHETAFKNMLTKVINDFGREKGYIKTREPNFEGPDVREGLTAIISVKISETYLEFSGQTKDKLSTPEIKKLVDEVVQKDLYF
jgi:topoisomerase-4 subunit B